MNVGTAYLSELEHVGGAHLVRQADHAQQLCTLQQRRQGAAERLAA